MLLRTSILFLILLLNTAFTQSGGITLYENDLFKLCGRYVTVDGIWINEGIIMADISTQTAINSKPITGGYKKGDEFKAGTDECVYYVHLITKSGVDSKGKVVLGKEIPLTPPPQDCESEFVFKKNIPYKIDTLDWTLTDISRNNSDSLEAGFNVSYSGMDAANYTLKPGAVLWTGECAYELENTPGTDSLRFKKLNEHFYGGVYDLRELYLPESREELIIRKMKVFKKMFPSEDDFKNTEEQIWLLKIFFYPGGIARPVIKVERNGKARWVEYETVRTFKTRREALDHAKENGIIDVKIED